MDASFTFKHMALADGRSGMKIGTDGVLLGAWAPVPPYVGRIVDAGAGCGLVALMLAQRTGGSVRIDAVETDPGACADSRDNVLASPWATRVSVVEGDFLCFEGRADMVVSNPPFYTAEMLASPDSPRRAARTEGALTVSALLARSDALLPPDRGCVSLVLPCERDAEVLFEGVRNRLHPRLCCRVSHREGLRPKRTLWYLERSDGALEEETLFLVGADGRRSSRYAFLTKDFYL